ncbi:hypothetical protein CRI94_03890 [Longibacter salinarum]|uniref:Uncharacterized protein n=1 Tax=Longibacter salinarum TaxID=1850348 RepID=A0A2A8D010_9BACT|nr:hypothetical protein [Longibacter salinarum]PEN14191.1 hypothetical protein CRI94_03890 [Longibacter salinarum]
MDETLRIIRHLYGEEPDPQDLQRAMKEDPALAREYNDLAEVKTLLDKKEPARPDASVLDAITEAAADASASHEVSDTPDRPRVDREPVSGGDRDRSRISRRLQQAGVAAAVLLLVAIGWWQIDMDDSASSVQISAQTERQLPAANRDLPDWDEGDDVVRLHRRLEVVNARSASPTSWNDRPDLIPTQSRRP